MALAFSLAATFCAMTFLLNSASYLLRAAGGTGGVRVSWGSWAVLIALLGGYTGRPLESELRDVDVLNTDEWSDDDAVVEARELRLDDGMRFLGGGGGGGPLLFVRTA